MEVIDEQEMLAPPQTLASLDLSAVTPLQLARIERELHFIIARDGDFGGVCCWFDTPFDGQSPEVFTVREPHLVGVVFARSSRAWGRGVVRSSLFSAQFLLL